MIYGNYPLFPQRSHVFHSIRSRLLLIVIFSLFSMLILMINLTVFSGKVALLSEIEKSNLHLGTTMLQLRRAEKNFLLHQDPKYLERFEHEIVDFTKTSALMHRQLEEMDISTRPLKHIEKKVDLYRHHFLNVVDHAKRLGPNESSGFKGMLRNAAGQLEASINHDQRLLGMFLQMHRAEKNFLEHRDLRYNEQQQYYYRQLHTTLATDPATLLLLEQYAQYFNACRNTMVTIGLNEEDGLMGTMRRAIHEVETEIVAIEKNIAPLIADKRNEVYIIGNAIFAFTALVLFLTIVISYRKLTEAFDAFLDFFRASKTSHATMDKDKIAFSEFQKMAQFANEMIDARVEAECQLKELNEHLEDRIAEGVQEIRSLNEEIEATLKEVLFTMGTFGENRSKEMSNHVRRVAEYTKVLALAYGLDDKEAEMLKQASPMHDIGKVAIPDAILNKPGHLDEDECANMQRHARMGYEMLKHSERKLLKTASIVAHEHHERWDGSGYPRGIGGEEIHIYGRITAIADVFDALGTQRCYKEIWNDEMIFEFFKEQRGKQFDPKLVDLFFANSDRFQAIREQFKDLG